MVSQTHYSNTKTNEGGNGLVLITHSASSGFLLLFGRGFGPVGVVRFCPSILLVLLYKITYFLYEIAK